MAERIGAGVVGDLLGLPDGVAARIPSALWLPCRVEDESDLLNELSSRWGELQWCGSWDPRAEGLFANFEGLIRRVVATCSFETPRGHVLRSDWIELDPRSEALGHFVAHLRATGGSGTCLLLGPADLPASAWYAPPLALVHRDALEAEDSSDHAAYTASQELVLAFVAAVTSSGCAALVPLNPHPWGGYAVLGGAEILSRLAELLPDDLAYVADVTPEGVLSGAGSLAL